MLDKKGHGRDALLLMQINQAMSCYSGEACTVPPSVNNSSNRRI